MCMSVCVHVYTRVYRHLCVCACLCVCALDPVRLRHSCVRPIHTRGRWRTQGRAYSSPLGTGGPAASACSGGVRQHSTEPQFPQTATPFTTTVTPGSSIIYWGQLSCRTCISKCSIYSERQLKSNNGMMIQVKSVCMALITATVSKLRMISKQAWGITTLLYCKEVRECLTCS